MGSGPVHLFFALQPPEAAGVVIEALGERLRRVHRLHGAKIARERLHNTLAAVQARRTLPDLVARARTAADRVRHQPFMVRFDWTESFDVRRDRYPFVLRGEVKPLRDFQQHLCGEMARAGLAAPHSFTPHITLHWADRRVEAYPVAPIAWTVTEFVLIASEVGQSRHMILDHWQLA
ncbi:MAG TPA: hypothetical protein VFI23_16365 [Rhizomicrobium sp.]|nr:hypothetical protein [Rhizomicrobium sp.]